MPAALFSNSSQEKLTGKDIHHCCQQVGLGQTDKLQPGARCLPERDCPDLEIKTI